MPTCSLCDQLHAYGDPCPGGRAEPIDPRPSIAAPAAGPMPPSNRRLKGVCNRRTAGSTGGRRVGDPPLYAEADRTFRHDAIVPCERCNGYHHAGPCPSMGSAPSEQWRFGYDEGVKAAAAVTFAGGPLGSSLSLTERKLLAIALLGLSLRHGPAVVDLAIKCGLQDEMIHHAAEYRREQGERIDVRVAAICAAVKGSRPAPEANEQTHSPERIGPIPFGAIVTMPLVANATIPDAIKMTCPCCDRPCWLRLGICGPVRVACTECALKGLWGNLDYDEDNQPHIVKIRDEKLTAS